MILEDVVAQVAAIAIVGATVALFSTWKSKKKKRGFRHRYNSLTGLREDVNWKELHFVPVSERAIMTEPERIFFATLRKALSSRSYVCPKVRVMDVINCPKDDFKKGGYILGKWHLDFVVMDVYYSTVKFCIEYDDSSHEDLGRRARDFHLDFAMSKAGVKLLRIPYKKYTVDELETLLKKHNCS